MAVFRCYVKRKRGFYSERESLLRDLKDFLQISALEGVEIFNRYDVEGISEDVYKTAKNSVFAEPPSDDVFDEELPPSSVTPPCHILAVEPLPGQYDQRADSCAACIQLITGGERPAVRCARVYIFYGALSDEDFGACRRWLINPVECREARLDKPETLLEKYSEPEPVLPVKGFINLDRDGLLDIISSFSLAMDIDDITFLQEHFKNEEKRDPTLTELRVLDTYWSDHCRHTTFLTRLESGKIEDEIVKAAYEKYLAARKEVYGENASTQPVTLMDIATIGAKLLKKRGILKNLDESPEVNACTVKIKAEIDGEQKDWLLLFKNETHNHPTEIEPFGGAATCLGGAIRDPLAGRGYVYQAMRVTGSGDPRTPVSETLPGKLPQRRITREAAAGYSSYGNQIGLATGLVDEIYHPGYVAKRLEIGAVVGAVPAENVVRKEPEPGDFVIVLGGRTGRDGCGGATGSSKSHSLQSLEQCGAEVQKGNAPEERKLLRLFRNPEVARCIKRCNDFGAGGVSVAIGELADGLEINLNALPKKYEGLSGTELAISESQERMAVVAAPEDVDFIISEAAKENIETSVPARVTDSGRLVMMFNGQKIVDLSRRLMNSNGAPKKAQYFIPELEIPEVEFPHVCGGPAARLAALASDLNICSKRGLSEMFDSSIGAGSVLAPYGGKYQLTPAQCMAAKLPVLDGETTTCSVMSYGFDPYITEKSPFIGSVRAVTESLAKLTAAGCDINNAYLSLQEYFERLRNSPERWGKPLSALLGAFTAQISYGVAAIGGKDSMSGSFENLDVPPTLVSFVISAADCRDIISPEFKAPGNPVYLFAAPYGEDGLPVFGAVKRMWAKVHSYIKQKKIISAFALTSGGLGEAVMKMALGNNIGFELDEMVDVFEICRQNCGAILAEASEPLSGGVCVGKTLSEPVIRMKNCPQIKLDTLIEKWEAPLSDIFPVSAPADLKLSKPAYPYRNTARVLKANKPVAVIPVFPGTNCEYDTARALEFAGGMADIKLVRNLTPDALRESAAAIVSAVKKAQMLIIPGGFSAGDEPAGSGKFIVAFFKNPALKDAVNELVNVRGGLVLGICNGFQALIKLGLLPFGEIRDVDASCPTLAHNAIGLHRARYVTTRVASVKSPWLSKCSLGEFHTIPVSHGEGRFVASDEMLENLTNNGQIAFQYTDLDGNPSMDTRYNPAGSLCAIEGITSPDGRVLGKMGHTERSGPYVAKNIPGNKYQPLFEGGVEYFK